jgi:hypothetical protein
VVLVSEFEMWSLGEKYSRGLGTGDWGLGKSFPNP